MHYAKTDNFEKAIIFFERASSIQPKEVKWRLMIGTCYRKMNLFNEAHKIYEDVYNLYPDNLDNLRMLVQIRKDLGLKFQDLMQKVMALDR